MGLQLVDLLGRLDLEFMKQERGIHPGSVQLGHEHPGFDLLRAYFFQHTGPFWLEIRCVPGPGTLAAAQQRTAVMGYIGNPLFF
jgi:hypothetical protein